MFLDYLGPALLALSIVITLILYCRERRRGREAKSAAKLLILALLITGCATTGNVAEDQGNAQAIQLALDNLDQLPIPGLGSVALHIAKLWKEIRP